MIAHRLEVAVVGGSFLLPMYWALRAVHVQYHSPVGCPHHGVCVAYPLSIKLLQTSQVLLGDKHFGLKSA